MSGDDIGEGLDQGGTIVQHGNALKLNAASCRQLLQLYIDIVERLDVIAEETDRRDEHMSSSRAGQLFNGSLDGGPKPGLAGPTLALVGERSWLSRPAEPSPPRPSPSPHPDTDRSWPQSVPAGYGQ